MSYNVFAPVLSLALESEYAELCVRYFFSARGQFGACVLLFTGASEVGRQFFFVSLLRITLAQCQKSVSP